MASLMGALLWAQWRIFRNFYPRRSKLGVWFTAVVAVVWYGVWTMAALLASVAAANPANVEWFRAHLPLGLLLVSLYWQLAPLLTAGAGASLDLKRLLIFPIPRRQLFTLEACLRLPVSAEMLLVLAGIAWGFAQNPQVPGWVSPLVFGGFSAFNVFLSIGLKVVIDTILRQKRLREVFLLLLILLAAAPQVLAHRARRESMAPMLDWVGQEWLPWTAAASLSMGVFDFLPFAALSLATALAYAFGRWQFERSILADAGREKTAASGKQTGRAWWDMLFTWPGRLFRDPLAAVVEKELRSLARTPRFRMVFIMGFTFGLLIWGPIAFLGNRSQEGWMSGNFLVLVSSYALLLLADNLFMNSFGFDRGAAQLYYVSPAPFATALRGKNIAALVFLFAEVTIVAAVCLLLRLPIPLDKFPEAYAVTLVYAIFLLAVGNLHSIQSPYGVDPEQTWKGGGKRRFQAIMLLALPLLSIPVMLAFVARYAFETEWAFYGTLAIGALVGLIVYHVATGVALESGHKRREEFIARLSESMGPISG